MATVEATSAPKSENIRLIAQMHGFISLVFVFFTITFGFGGAPLSDYAKWHQPFLNLAIFSAFLGISFFSASRWLQTQSIYYLLQENRAVQSPVPVDKVDSQEVDSS